MMHALYFLREKGKTHRREYPTCDGKRGEGKGEMDNRPKMKNGPANLYLKRSANQYGHLILWNGRSNSKHVFLGQYSLLLQYEIV